MLPLSGGVPNRLTKSCTLGSAYPGLPFRRPARPAHPHHLSGVRRPSATLPLQRLAQCAPQRARHRAVAGMERRATPLFRRRPSGTGRLTVRHKVGATTAVMAANDLVGLAVDRVTQRFLLDALLAGQLATRCRAFAPPIVIAIRVLVTLVPVFTTQGSAPNGPLQPSSANTSATRTKAQSRSSRLIVSGGAKRIVVSWVSLHSSPFFCSASQ